MKTDERTDLLAAIAELCQRYPDWRLGQLVANAAGWADREIWDVEDDICWKRRRWPQTGRHQSDKKGADRLG